MKRCLILLLALPLMGCFADQQQQLAKCIAEAELEHENETWLIADARQTYVWLCMAAYGYRLNRQQSICHHTIPPMGDAALYAQCYQPGGRFSLLIHKLEIKFGRTPNK